MSTTDNQVDLEKLCRLLGEDYEREHDQMSLAAYDRISQKFILSLAPLVFDGKLGSSMRRALSCILGRNKKINKELLQLHLLRNEAYFYAAKHALEVKVRRNYAHE